MIATPRPRLSVPALPLVRDLDEDPETLYSDRRLQEVRLDVREGHARLHRRGRQRGLEREIVARFNFLYRTVSVAPSSYRIWPTWKRTVMSSRSVVSIHWCSFMKSLYSNPNPAAVTRAPG